MGMMYLVHCTAVNKLLANIECTCLVLKKTFILKTTRKSKEAH